MFTFNETDKAVQEFLNSASIKYRVNYVGAMDHEECKHDLFSVQFIVTGKTPLITEYKTGAGHRLVPTTKGGAYNFMKYNKAQGLELSAHREALGLASNESIYFPVKTVVGGQRGHGGGEVITYAVTPTSASVLHSLVLDASALDQNFDDWADDLGYDSDSLNALNIYKACCDNGKKLRKIFTNEQIETLQELLQDY